MAKKSTDLSDAQARMLLVSILSLLVGIFIGMYFLAGKIQTASDAYSMPRGAGYQYQGTGQGGGQQTGRLDCLIRILRGRASECF